MNQPVKTLETIVLGTESILKAASRYRKPVLITSTSEVYGKSKDVPFREEGDRLNGATDKHRWAYACAKALDEFLALAHYKESRLPVTIARLFNTVGPRQSGQYGMVVPNFVRHALAGNDLTVHGDGTQSRCFAHVSDVVRALELMIDSEKCKGQVLNLGSQEEVTINDLAQLVCEITESDSVIRHVPYDQVYGEGFEDMARRVPDIQKANRLIDWQPQVPLRQTIQDVATEIQSQ